MVNRARLYEAVLGSRLLSAKRRARAVSASVKRLLGNKSYNAPLSTHDEDMFRGVAYALLHNKPIKGRKVVGRALHKKLALVRLKSMDRARIKNALGITFMKKHPTHTAAALGTLGGALIAAQVYSKRKRNSRPQSTYYSGVPDVIRIE